LKSATFDNKQLTKTIQKSLFKTNEQIHESSLKRSTTKLGNNILT